MRNHQQNGPEKKAMESALDLDDIKIPEYVLDGEKSKGESRHIPKSPMLVFINTKSGGQLGIRLLETFHKLLNSHQVFDLSKGQPDEVLQRVLQNMEKLKTEGDQVAEEIRKSLKLVVAGGDGTAGWLLGIVSDLKLNDPPPIATIPLGTGNNLPFSFGWGKKNPGTDVQSVKRFLRDVVDAHPLKVDSWHLIMTMDDNEDFEPEAPHSLHVFKKAEGKPQAFRGGFWNYFSIGMDAQVSYEFHTKRKEHPEKFKNQLRNQCTYAKLGCTQGWFIAPCMHPSSRNINDLATVFIAKRDGPWEELEISSGIRSLVLLNLPSFSGGLDPWGTPNDKKSLERGLTNPSVNDGLLELVGFRDGWHGMFLLFPNGHGTRLAQAHRVKIEFKRGASKHTYMRMDGEPWKQPLPDHEHGTVIEISHHGQAVMLAREGCIAESKDDYKHTLSFTVKEGLEHGLHAKSNARQQDRKLHHQHDPEIADDCDDQGDEAKRKFGASSTFKP